MTDTWPFGDLVPGRYACIAADPPWKYSVFTPKGEGRSASRHYQTMSLAEIKALPVRALAAKDCHLFLWTTGPNLRQTFAVIDAWGFRYSAMAFVWVKLKGDGDQLWPVEADFHIGMGHTTRHNAELCLLARKGNPKRLRKDVRELIMAARRQHSRKPEAFFERVEAYCAGPRAELFSRTNRPGWSAWGAQSGKFNRLAAA